MTAPTRIRRQQPPVDKRRAATSLIAWCQRCPARWPDIGVVTDGSSHVLANARAHTARTGHPTTSKSETTIVYEPAQPGMKEAS